MRELLNFARQSEPRKEPCNINRIIESALSLTKNQLKVSENYVTMVKEFGDLPSLQADPDQMLEVFINMIINAIDAMPQGGELRTTTRLLEKEKSVEIRVDRYGARNTRRRISKKYSTRFSRRKKQEKEPAWGWP